MSTQIQVDEIKEFFVWFLHSDDLNHTICQMMKNGMIDVIQDKCKYTSCCVQITIVVQQLNACELPANDICMITV